MCKNVMEFAHPRHTSWKHTTIEVKRYYKLVDVMLWKVKILNVTLLKFWSIITISQSKDKKMFCLLHFDNANT